jgi:hypothetical protein
MSQQERLVRYVMGELSETEQEQTEAQYFAEAEFLQEVQAVCDDLMDAYLNGELSAHDRARLEQRLHAIPFLHDQVATSRALLHFVNAAAQPPAAPRPKRRWAWAGWWGLVRERVPFPQVLAVVGVLAMLVVGRWYGSSSRPSEVNVAQVSPTPLVTPTAQPTSSPATPTTVSPPKSSVPVNPTAAPVLPVVASLFLSAEVTRGAADLPQLRLPGTHGLALLQLELPQRERRFYQASLQTAQGQPLKSWHHLAPTRHSSASVLELKVPVGMLAAGAYQVQLSPDTNTIHQFRFRVVFQ